jgi:hypothetical protein
MGYGEPRVWMCAAIAAVALGGCVSTAHTQPMVLGPLAADDAHALFERAMSVSREAGYTPVHVDELHGEFAARMHTMGANGRAAYILVQVYADGWVRTFPVGPGVRRTSSEIVVTSALLDDHRRLTLALARGLALPRGASSP